MQTLINQQQLNLPTPPLLHLLQILLTGIPGKRRVPDRVLADMRYPLQHSLTKKRIAQGDQEEAWDNAPARPRRRWCSRGRERGEDRVY